MPIFPIVATEYIASFLPVFLGVTAVISLVLEMLYSYSGAYIFSTSFVTTFSIINILLLSLLFGVLYFVTWRDYQKVGYDKLVEGLVFTQIGIIFMIVIFIATIVARYSVSIATKLLCY
jgi:hypothetical protein